MIIMIILENLSISEFKKILVDMNLPISGNKIKTDRKNKFKKKY